MERRYKTAVVARKISGEVSDTCRSVDTTPSLDKTRPRLYNYSTQLTFDKLTHSKRVNQEAEIKTVNMIRPRGSNGPLSSKASATDA
ncbi:uncharacterized protein RSE6_02215 [Rhynchosporium secalis]|uniref:Uncharacterized protein n=1 Tax=Rhynchosporium secalis TaxID=38038 RepID=A0A1E1LZQ4_RHYSE|nr:uncharacterized protein RSE6_02215 [Rhynchosporium secalis]